MKRHLIPLILTIIALAAPAVAVVSPPHIPEPRTLRHERLPFVADEVLLKVKPGVSPAAMAATVNAMVVRQLGDGSIMLLKLRRGDAGKAVATLRGRSEVHFAEPNWLRQPHLSPDDPSFSLKWDLDNSGLLCDGTDCATAGDDIDWLSAYSLLGTGFIGSATLAVIDTGIDSGHPDLAGKILLGYDFLADVTDPIDTYGHGTHVSGIAMAATNNRVGTAGVAFSPGIKVLPLRVCDISGCPTSAIVDAIYYAANLHKEMQNPNKADVINLSLGGPIGSSAEQQAINAAWNAGLVIVASSGNDGSGKVSYPAAFANAIAVGATDWHDQVTSYSNKGSALDLTAPGGAMSSYHDPGGIYSTMPINDVYLTSTYGYSTGYDQLQGTSMAAPQVSGLAALLFALNTIQDTNSNGRINDEIRAILQSTADDLGSAGWDRSYGWGRINAHRAIQSAQADSGGTDSGTGGGDLTVTVSTDKEIYTNRSKAQLSATVTDDSNKAIAGAAVHFTVTTPPLKTSSCDAITATDGSATCTYTINTKRDGTGTFTLTATASKDGYSDGSATTTFVVQ